MHEPSKLAGRLLAHRGLWEVRAAMNTPDALVQAAISGFSIETDLRDSQGTLLISHDPPSSGGRYTSASDLLPQIVQSRSRGTLALNVKADGLVQLAQPIQAHLSNWNVFYFDMSWPQTLSFVRSGLPVALRVSEYEPLNHSLFARLGIPVRVWLDAFEDDWWLGRPEIDALGRQGQVAIVSPEIHGRDPHKVWEWFANQVELGSDVLLCTDRCIEFMEKFG